MSRTDRLPRRAFLARTGSVAACLAAPAVVTAQARSARVAVVVAGKSSLAHLPLTLAEQLGYFRSEGLLVEVQDAGTSQRALDLLTEGGAEVCAGGFDHALLLHARGQPQQAFVLQARAPQLVVGVSLRSMPGYRSPPDLLGKRIGVAEPGSAASLLARLVLSRAGLAPDDVVLVDVAPQAAVAALRTGHVDALVQPEPVMSALEQRAEVRIIADTRSLKGTAEVFGGPMPSACLHAGIDYVQRHAAICQALAHGVVHALKWLQTAGPGDLLKAVPEPYLLGDRALYLGAFAKVRDAISTDGLFPPEAVRHAQRVLTRAEPGLRMERIDVERSYTNEFARRAKERFRA